MAGTSKRISISEMSRVTGLDRATIATKLRGVDFHLGDKDAKMYERKAALALVLGNAAPRGEDAAKLRKASADAEKVELVVKRLKGELVSADSMRSAAAELVKTLFQRIVRVEPSIIASKCIGKSAIEIETITREQLSIVFNELKNMPENFLSVEDDDFEPEIEPDGV